MFEIIYDYMHFDGSKSLGMVYGRYIDREDALKALEMLQQEEGAYNIELVEYD